jgi:hypothetical protein
MDPTLWRTERFADFLAARQELLAEAANDFLNSLLAGDAPSATTLEPEISETVVVRGGIVDQVEEELLLETNFWVMEQGLPEGELLYELTLAETGDVTAILDLAWPEGIQTGYSEPVALLIDEDLETLEVASSAGFRCFSNIDGFRTYVQTEILAQEMASA